MITYLAKAFIAVKLAAYNMETGKLVGVYPSFSKASRELHLSTGNISDYFNKLTGVKRGIRNRKDKKTRYRLIKEFVD